MAGIAGNEFLLLGLDGRGNRACGLKTAKVIAEDLLEDGV
jgi:hypothetical protein